MFRFLIYVQGLKQFYPPSGCWNGLTCQPAWGNMTVADMSLPLKALHFNAHHLACIYNTTDTANPTESAQYIAQYGKVTTLTFESSPALTLY